MTATGQPRRVFFLDRATMRGDEYVPSIVVENQPGHTPCDFSWGTDYDVARRIADEANQERGHSPQDVRDVIMSSMRLGSTRR